MATHDQINDESARRLHDALSLLDDAAAIRMSKRELFAALPADERMRIEAAIDDVIDPEIPF